jgi:hypothetical protein
MDAKRCDRCGAFYVPKMKGTEEVKTQLEMVVAAVKNTKKHITDICDLCPKCVMAFYEWLRCAKEEVKAND